MVDSVTSVQAAFNAALQSAELSTLVNAHVDNPDTSFSLDIIPPNIEASAQSGAQADIVEGLLNLDSSTLALFNEVGNEPRSVNVTGNLSAQQLQEIGVLQEDLLKLEEASLATNLIPLTNGASTVDLSITAQDIALATATANSSTTVPELTSTQLSQIAQIITPYLNQPLTPALVLQIQTQLVANQLNPMHFSMSVFFLVQNYLVAFQQPMPHQEAEEFKRHDNENEYSVAPVSSVDKAAAEDSAIRG